MNDPKTLEQTAGPAVGEWPAFIAAILLSAPALIYGSFHVVLALGLHELLVPDGGVVFVASIVGPYTSALSMLLVLMLIVGGRSTGKKVIALVLTVIGITAFIAYPPANMLGG